MKTKWLLNPVLLTFAFFIFSFTCESYAGLKGGTAKANITPPVGVCWAFDDKEMVDVENDLFAKALVLDDGKNRIALISTDLLWVPGEITSEIRSLIHQNTGIPEQNILVCATHTHYVPNIWSKHVSKSPVCIPYVRTFIKKAAGTVIAACNDMKDISIGFTKGQLPEIIYNRRTKNTEGKVEMSFVLQENSKKLSFGPIDPEVGIIRVNNSEGSILASLINFACHPTSGGYGDLSYVISTDYPGYATKVIEDIEGGTCLFTLGAAGDIVVVERGEKQRKQAGKALGAEALKKLQNVKTTNNNTIKVQRKLISLPLKTEKPQDGIIKNNPGEKDITTEIQAFAIGDIYILGLPGEILVEIGLEIKRRFKGKKLLIISISNDAIGYVCHCDAYREGGYEPDRATNLAEGAGEIIMEEALLLLHQLQ